MKTETKNMKIQLKDFCLELQIKDGRFLGIGAVTYGKTPLRSPSLPWTFYTESDQGVRFEEFKLVKVSKSPGGGRTIVFTSAGRWLPRIQDADAMGDARIMTRRATVPTATFHWTFRPIAERIQENEWPGLAMQLTVSSPGVPLHWMIEDTTWEIGGAAGGATLIQQDVSTMDLEQSVQKTSAFSTIEKFFTDGWGGSHPMDMLPRAAGSAICDFQTKGDLALCLFAEKPGLTRARLEKFADEALIHYTDRPFVPLAEKISLPERKLLVYRHPQKLKRHEWRNLWLDCFTEVRRRILAVYDFKLEVPEPCVGAHLWDDDLKARGAKWFEPLQAALPEYGRLGYRGMFTHGVWESVTSDDDPKVSGNICCPYAYRFAEKFGGAEGMKRLNATAAKAGVRIFQWYAPQLSRFAPVWKEHPEWLLREANGDPWDAGYTNVLWSGRMHGDFGREMLRQIKQVKRDTGIDGAFWDSYQNLGVTCIDWQGKEKMPQAEAMWRIQGELQRTGYRQRCEVVTIFGVSQVAMYGFEDDKFRRRLWADTVRNDDAFALLDCSPAFFSKGIPPISAERINPALYFWLAGHRALPSAGAQPWGETPNPKHAGPRLPGGELAEEYGKVNHLYNAALPHMQRLRVVENGTHTLWLDKKNKPTVIWVFRDTTISHRGTVIDLADGLRSSVDGKLTVQAGHVYRLV
jgi:hypothetical protein